MTEAAGGDRDERVPFAAAPATAAPAVPASAVPGSVQAVLSPDEIVILVLRPSVLYIVLSSLGTLAASAVIAATLAWASTSAWSAWSEPGGIAVGVLLAAARLTWGWLDWYTHAFVLTDRRVIARRGVLRTALHEAPLVMIQNTVVVQSLRERIFGLGTIGFATAGRSTFDAYWEMVPRPFVVHGQVLDAVRRYGRK
jgi:uncharacterized membrane protein YdbT with pleckstrin-like domain